MRKLYEECTVIIDGEKCSAKHVAKGFCGNHYRQNAKGKPFTVPRKFRRREAVLERNSLGQKQCVRCTEWKDEDEFFANSYSHDLLEASCIPCARDRSAQWRAANPERVTMQRRKHSFGLSSEGYDAILQSQDYRCAICGTAEPGGRGWVLDHDHSHHPESYRGCPDCVRSFLCPGCNFLLGNAREDISILESAIQYLDKYNSLKRS